MTTANEEAFTSWACKAHDLADRLIAKDLDVRPVVQSLVDMRQDKWLISLQHSPDGWYAMFAGHPMELLHVRDGSYSLKYLGMQANDLASREYAVSIAPLFAQRVLKELSTLIERNTVPS